MNEQNRDERKNNVDEHPKRIISIKMNMMKIDDFGKYDWQGLSVLSYETFLKAERFLARKDYAMFSLYLRHYADIWQYAYLYLNQEDCRYFCCSQSAILKPAFQ